MIAPQRHVRPNGCGTGNPSRIALMSPRSVRPGAGEREPRQEEQPIRQLVGFRLDGDDYAIAITKIREIILMKPITRLPQVPDSIEGLINLRGTVIPIINLRKRFGLPARPFDDETRTIVVTIEDKTVGCIVDEVTQVMRLSADQFQPVPISMASVAQRYIAGLARLEDRLVIILDIDRLLAPEEAALDFGAKADSPMIPTPDESPGK
jgi:purine-binding chemotaxis protein CheW